MAADIIEAAERAVEACRRAVESNTLAVPGLFQAMYDLQESVKVEHRAGSVEEIPTGNLVILLQKLAKRVNYVNPGFRSALLNEAARRLNDYRQKERQWETPVLAISPSEAEALLRGDPFDEQEAAIRAAERKQ